MKRRTGEPPRGQPPASEDEYRAAFEQAAVGLVRSSLAGELRSVNPAFCAMLGYSHTEALRFHIRDITHPDDIALSTEHRAGLVQGGGAPYERELRLLRKDGAYLWTNVATSLLRTADGRPQQFVSVVSDISRRKRAEQELERFRAAMDATVDAIFLADPDTMRFLFVNETACRRLGFTREQMLEKPPFEVLGKTREELRREQDAVIAAGERGTRTESRFVRHDGSEGWTELYRRAHTIDGSPVIVTIARDITERKEQQERIERLSRVHAMLSGINAAIVRIRNRDELFREACRIAHEAGGFAAVSIHLIDEQRKDAEPVAWHGHEESVGWLRQAVFPLRFAGGTAPSLLVEMVQTRRPAITNDAQNDPRVPFRQAMARFAIHSAVFLPLIVAERVVALMSMYSPLKGHFDEVEVKLLSDLAADISFALEHLANSERAAYLALYDELTGLANRHLLAERLAQFFQAAGQSQTGVGLALLDIERLRSVNKALGRHAGDALVRQFAERLEKTAIAGAGTAARIASNHFAVVVPGVRDRAEAERLITAIARVCFGETYLVDGTELRVGVKMGLVTFPHDGADVETLLLNAETALRKAKETRERQVSYTADLGERGVGFPLESQLARALERDEFVLHYQPKVATATRRVVGLEALLRWQSPELGLVAPMKFIPLMEENGMILEVGAWALRRASHDHRRWTEQGLAPLRVAVNISPLQLRQRDFVRTLEHAIRAGGKPAGIDLEITEGLAMENVEENIRKLNELRALGVQVAIDDFGTGYSSLSHLAQLPVQALKIDRSFISAMLKDAAAMTLVQTIISLAHALRLEVIAEGVEEEEQTQRLRLLGCDQIQGYLVSRPAPFDEVTGFLRANQLATPAADMPHSPPA
jgi:PAS domain S-box-containing protein/diguanylate cyclase (GGDEF)-like protein